MQIGVQFLLVAPGGAVDARQHGVAVIAAPIGAGHLHQLEGGADIGGAAHMRAAAQVDPVALGIKADGFATRQVLDDLGLVFLALVLEELDRLVAVHHAARETGRRAAMISRIFASMAGKSSGVNGWLRAKS